MTAPTVAIIVLLVVLNIAQAMYARVLERRLQAMHWRLRIDI